nr:siderophore-interacting protein [Saccharothrix sp. ST-888]
MEGARPDCRRRSSSFPPLPASVARTSLVAPHIVRITLAGDDLTGFVNGGLDQRIKPLLPLPGQHEPQLPSDEGDFAWYQAWRQMPVDERPTLRTYTVRAQRRDPDEIDIDVALHGDVGPGSRWAAAVRELRRHLVRERGFEARAVCFMGYWRAGRTEDDAADQTDPES